MRRYFPNLTTDNFKKTSEYDKSYNCIAWAYGRNDIKLWPNPNGLITDYKWISGISNKENINSFIELYGSIGYEVCIDGITEIGYEKISIYEKDGLPTHASKQLPNGNWSSKMGDDIDVEHTEFALKNGFYGNVTTYMKRKISK